MKNKLLLGLLVFTFGFARYNEDDPKMVLVLGDSLAAGYGLQASQAFPALLQQKIDALGWDMKVINAGLSGDTSAGELASHRLAPARPCGCAHLGARGQ